MSLCNALNGLALSCLPNVKGIVEIYINDHDEVDSLTKTGGNVTAINLIASPTTLFQTYEILKNNGSTYTEKQIDPTQGLSGWESVITLILNRRQLATRDEIEILASGYRSMDIIVLDQNGIYWYFGEVSGLNLTNTEGGAEPASYTLTFTGTEPYQAYTVDSAAVLAVLA